MAPQEAQLSMITRKTKKTKADHSRERILDAAAKLFRAQGYHSVRLTDIAAEAGLQKGSLYYHFGSREDIVVEVLNIGVDRVFDAVSAKIAGLPAATSPRERMVVAMEEHLRLALQQDDYIAANLRIYPLLPEPIRQTHAPIRRKYSDLWRTMLEDAAAAGDLRNDLDLAVLRMVLLGTVTWSTEWYRPGAALSIEQIARQMTSIVFDGASAPGNGNAAEGR